MAFHSLRNFVEHLERKGELIRISEPVDPELEITEIVDRMSKTEGGGKALLFENNGTQFPVLINAYGSEKRMALALGCENLDHI
jgi:4-hydroxy-3-polyprenylbenzoate decarboxylase